jgi:hypothetical protein
MSQIRLYLLLLTCCALSRVAYAVEAASEPTAADPASGTSSLSTQTKTPDFANIAKSQSDLSKDWQGNFTGSNGSTMMKSSGGLDAK